MGVEKTKIAFANIGQEVGDKDGLEWARYDLEHFVSICSCTTDVCRILAETKISSCNLELCLHFRQKLNQKMETRLPLT